MEQTICQHARWTWKIYREKSLNLIIRFIQAGTRFQGQVREHQHPIKTSKSFSFLEQKISAQQLCGGNLTRTDWVLCQLPSACDTGVTRTGRKEEILKIRNKKKRISKRKDVNFLSIAINNSSSSLVADTKNTLCVSEKYTLASSRLQ